MRGLPGASNAALFGLLICAVPAFIGAWYAFRPGERLLSFMRPLTLAAVFSALCTFVLAISNGFIMVSTMPAFDLPAVHRVALVVTEGLAPVAASFACMAFAWACIAIGTRRA